MENTYVSVQRLNDFAGTHPVDPTASSHMMAAFDGEYVARVIFNQSQTRDTFASSCEAV